MKEKKKPTSPKKPKEKKKRAISSSSSEDPIEQLKTLKDKTKKRKATSMGRGGGRKKSFKKPMSRTPIPDTATHQDESSDSKEHPQPMPDYQADMMVQADFGSPVSATFGKNDPATTYNLESRQNSVNTNIDVLYTADASLPDRVHTDTKIADDQ
jgi:hypothetical protein